MQIGGRSVTKILTSVLQKQHYIAASNMVRIYERPLDALGRYLLQIGNYPETIVVLTPIGRIPLRIYSHHDMLTVNEIFCRLDYMAQADDRVVVDFGSNIGISAAYFLTRAPHSHVYLYEPLDVNVERLHKNLQPFDGRYTLHKAAIALGEGEAEFGWEESGRYGGIGIKTGNYIRVKCLDSNEVLKTILARHGRINILKIDVESLEKELTEHIPVDVAKYIEKIYVEYNFHSNPLEQTHDYIQYGSVAQFFNKSTARHP